MQRPILIVVLGYIIGIIIGLYCKISIAFLYIVLIPIVLLIKKYINSRRDIRRYYNLLISKSMLISFLVSSVIANTITLYKDNSYENKYKNIEESNFVAIVASDVKEKEYYKQYKIKVISINTDKQYANTYLLLNLKENSNLEYGDKISFRGEYKEPERQRNYKGFSYKNYLKSIGIHGTVKVDSVTKLGKENINPVIKISNTLRNYIKENVKNNIENEDKRNLLLGILLGYDDELSSTIKEQFSDSGISHILAVSGMHVSYVVMGVTFALKKVKLPKKITSIITILFLIFFIFLTGEMPSVKRACIMTILLLGASILYRKSDVVTNISFSLLIILIQNPFSILDTGLILSFCATLGIICLNNSKQKNENVDNKLPIKKKNTTFLNKIYLKIKEIVEISLWAQFFILPISIFLFNKVTLTFLFSNLIVSSFISAIIILGLISAIIPIKFMYFILNILLEILLLVANFFAKLPISKIIITTPHIILVILYYVILISFITIRILKKKEIKRRIEKQILTNVDKFKHVVINKRKQILIIFMIIILLIQCMKILFPELKIHFIDVGQGDSMLIITPSNKTILIDGGGNKDTENFDVGKQTLLPYLLDRKIKKIDYLMISHFDVDHSNGTIAVLENIKVKTLVISKQIEISDEYEKIIEIVKRKNVDVLVVEAGNQISIDKEVKLQILYPEENLKYADLNNNSIVAKLTYNNFSMLFTGDIEKEAEQHLVNKYANTNVLKSTILKIPHHGSKTSSTEKMLQEVNPRVALIGVGKNNMFGHPNTEVLERLEKINCKIYRTDEMGEITIKVNKNGKICIDAMIKYNKS